MGFMAGFGPSFAQGFNAARERSHEAKQDAFRLTYQDFMQRQQQYDEWNREDAKFVKTAQDYEQMYDLPEGSWTQIYSWVKSGHDADQIQEWVQKGKWETTDVAQPANPAEAPQATGIDAEMQGTGMAPMEAPPQQAPQAEQRDTGLFGSLLGNLAQKGKKRTQSSFERRRAGAIDQVAAASGRSVEDVQNVMAGYKGPSLPESNVRFTAPALAPEKDEFTEGNAAYIEQAQAHDVAKRSPTPQNLERARQADIRVKAIQDRTFIEAEADALSKGMSVNGAPTTIWSNGEYKGSGRLITGQDGSKMIALPGQPARPLEEGETTLPITKEEFAARADARTNLNKATEDLQLQRQNISSAFLAANGMNETIRNTNGEVLKPITAGVTSKIEQWAIDFATGAEKISQAFSDPKNEGKPVVSQEMFQQAIAAEQALLQADKTDLGAQKLLYDTQKVILAYRIGMAMGQEGRGLAEAERKLFTDIATGGVTVEQFYNNMSGILMPIVKSIDTGMSQQYKKANDAFAQDGWGYVPNDLTYTPLSTELSTGDTAALFQELVKRDRSGPANIIDTGKTPDGPTNAQVEEQVSGVVTVNTPEEAMKLPSGTKFKSPDGKIRIRP